MTLSTPMQASPTAPQNTFWRWFRTLGLLVGTMEITLFSSLRTSAAVSFTRDIAPLFMDTCLDCHRTGKSKGGYRLDTFEAMLKPGDSGNPPFLAGQVEKSHLLTLLRATDPDDRMPQKADPLPREKIQIVEQWIQAGLPFDGSSRTNLMTEWVQNEDGRAPETYTAPLPLTALAYWTPHTPSPPSLVVAGYHEVVFWDLENKRMTQRRESMPERILALVPIVQPSALVVAGGTPGKRGEVWWIPGGPGAAAAPQRLLVLPEVVFSAALSPDSRWLAVGSGDQSLRVYSIERRQWLPVVEAHSDWVVHVAFSGDSTRLGTASRDKSAKVFSLPALEQISAYYEHQEPLGSIMFPAAATHVITTARQAQWHLWDQVEGKKKKDLGPAEEDILRLESLTGLEDKKSWMLSLTRGGRIILHENPEAPRKVQVLETSPGEGEWISWSWNPAKRELATGSDRGVVGLWNWAGEGGFRRNAEVIHPLPEAVGGR